VGTNIINTTQVTRWVMVNPIPVEVTNIEFSINGVTYPAGSCSLQSEAELFNLGLFKLVDTCPKVGYYQRASLQDANDWIINSESKTVLTVYRLENISLEEAKVKKISNIDKQTQLDILAIASEAKQRNYIAKAVQLEKKQRQGLTDEAEDTQLVALESIWTQIEALVNNGNAKELLVQEATTIEEVEAI